VQRQRRHLLWNHRPVKPAEVCCEWEGRHQLRSTSPTEWNENDAAEAAVWVGRGGRKVALGRVRAQPTRNRTRQNRPSCGTTMGDQPRTISSRIGPRQCDVTTASALQRGGSGCACCDAAGRDAKQPVGARRRGASHGPGRKRARVRCVPSGGNYVASSRQPRRRTEGRVVPNAKRGDTKAAEEGWRNKVGQPECPRNAKHVRRPLPCKASMSSNPV